MPKISDNIPQVGASLANYSGKQVIDRIGENIIKELVTAILCGDNVRSLTEGLTRRRLAISNASILATFIKSANNIDNFIDKMPQLIKKELLSKISKEKKLYLQWFIGLTGKSVQNVLRSNPKEFDNYLSSFEKSLKESIEKCDVDLEKLNGRFELGEMECSLNWKFMIYLFAAIGSQTLAIRGSEKSLYGKLFEKLILGSLLSILGFTITSSTDKSKNNKVFWLSQRGNKRESDATLLYKPGVGVRFDIGFIGPGNTEISLDKVSRFEREMEHGRQTYFMSTIILVDRIGDRSRIVEMAKLINGDIVQMSMNYWVKNICNILSDKIGFKHEILNISDAASLKLIEREMKKVNLKAFI